MVVSSGTTDITHTHLDTLGFPISDPQHQHSEALPPKITQNALSGTGGLLIFKNNGEDHIITFPDPGPGTWATVEYGIGFEWGGTISGGNTEYVNGKAKVNAQIHSLRSSAIALCGLGSCAIKNHDVDARIYF